MLGQWLFGALGWGHVFANPLALSCSTCRLPAWAQPWVPRPAILIALGPGGAEFLADAAVVPALRQLLVCSKWSQM